MDLKEDLTKPNATDYFEDWFKMVPEVGEPKEKPVMPEMDYKPSPLPVRDTNTWFTQEPAVEKQADDRKEEMMKWIIDHSDNPEETMARMRASHYMAEQHDLDPTYVYNNLEVLTQEYYGRKMDGKTAWQSIQDSRKTGQITSELADLYYQKMWGDNSEETQSRIDELIAQMPSPDEQKRSIPVQAMKSFMEMLPMMGDIFLEGSKKGIVSAVGGGTMVALAGNLGPQMAVPEEIATVPSAAMYMYSIGQAGGSATASVRKEAGLAYMDMIQSGVSEDVAKIVAMGVGAVNGTIEVVQIASIPGLSDLMKKSLQQAAQRGVEKALAGNGIKKLAWEFGKRYAGGIAEETSQELVQETVSFIGEKIATEMEGIDAPGKEEYLDRMKDTAIQSVLGFGVMALPGSVVNSDTAAVIRKMREGVPASTVKTESGEAAPGPQVRQYRPSETSIPMEIENIQILGGVNPSSKEFRLAQEQYQNAKAGTGFMPPIKAIATEDGYVAATATDEALLQVALEEGDTAIQVEVIQDETENQAVFPETAQEGVNESAIQTAKEDWQKTSEEFLESQQEIQAEREEFIQTNTIEDLTANIRTAFPNMTTNEVYASVALVEARAAVQGKNVDEYIRDTFDSKVFSREKVLAQDGTKASYKAAAERLADGKNLIHLTEQSDFSSWIHEYGHIIRPELPQGDQQILLDHYQSTEWNRDTEESFVKDFEEYLYSGKAPKYELQEIFRRIKDALQKIWDRIGRTVSEDQMPQEVRAVFDRIFRDPKDVYSIKEQTGQVDEAMLDHSLDDVLFQTEAYHGSPYSFDQFSLDYMGAGEGFQAFGWGLYFTSEEDIARFYANNLTETRVDGKKIEELDDIGFSAMIEVRQYGTPEEAIRHLMDNSDFQKPKIAELSRQKAKWLGDNIEKIQADDRNLYSVTLNPEKDDAWLSWNEPFPKEKRAAVKAELKKLGMDPELNGIWDSKTYGKTVEGIYRKLVGMFMGYGQLMENEAQKQASLLLNRVGFDGIKYPANSLLGPGDGSNGWNYVVFDEKQVRMDDHVLFQPEDIFAGSDGLSYTIHEEGADYETEADNKIYEKISRELEALQEPSDSGAEEDRSVSRRPTDRPVYNQWRKQKRVDLTGFVAGDVKDLAEAFSVYRNPYNEYVHFIYTKTNPETGETIILGHNALTSGLPGLTVGTEDISNPVKSLNRLERRMKRLGADEYFILHNHPSGNPEPSRADLRLTNMYEEEAPGFGGHLILNHETFGFIGHNGRVAEHSYIPKVQYGDRIIKSNAFKSPDELAAYSKSVMGDGDRDALIYLDGANRVLAFEPVRGIDHETAYQKMRANGASLVVYATSNEGKYEELALVDKKIQHEKSTRDVFIDIFCVTGEGENATYRSAMEEYYKYPGGWQDNSFKNSSSGFLFQPSEEHAEIVRQAVEDFKPVPDSVLAEYKDRDWARAEIERRKTWQKYSWLENMAIGFDDWQELKAWFMDHGGAEQTGDVKKLGKDSEDRFYKELWMRANYKTRDENNQAFIKQYANRQGVMALAAEMAGDPHQFKGKGVPGPLFTLERAMRGRNGVRPQHIQAAITSLKNNPTEVRRAFAQAQGDEETLDLMLFEDEMEDLTPIEAKVRDLSAKDRIKQALDTKDPELRNALLSGDASTDSLREMYQAVNRKIATLEAQHTKQVNELKEQLGRERSRSLALTETLEKKITEAREANNAAELDKLELIKKTRAEMRGNWKKKREIEIARDHMKALAYNIQRKPSPLTIHVDYQKEIMELQQLLHPGFRRKGDAEAWFKKNEFYKKYPGALDVLKPEDVEKILKKPLNYWSMEELEELNGKINLLREQGRDKLLEQRNEEENAARHVAVYAALEMGNGKVAAAPNVPHTAHNEVFRQWLETSKGDALKIESWRPSRLLRAMGGEGGVLDHLFWRDINSHTDAELKMVQKRQGAMKETLKDLDIKMKDLQRPIQGPDGPFPANDVIQWYIVRDNEENMKALEFGVGVNPEGMHYYFEQLKPNEIKLAEAIAKDFEDNYDRYAEAFARDKNQVMGKVEGGYFPMRRIKLAENERAEDIARDLATSAGARKGYPARRGTHSRQDISEEHQDPIKLGAIDLWMNEVVEQEHYINSKQYIKQMQRVIADPVFQTAVIDKHGQKMMEWFTKYANEFANPTIYKVYDSTSQISKMLRNNLAIAYLSCNMLTVAKQFPSVALFMGRVGPVQLMASAAKFMANPFKWQEKFDFVNERDPQMKDRSMDRIFEEMKAVKNSKWDKSIKPVQRAFDTWEGFIKKWGEVGMAPISWVDKMATTIGWLAVYDQNVAKVGEDEAIRLAQEAVLETQPAARAKDLAQLYRSSEGLNWFLMFTNQINQTWNIITADIPEAMRKAGVKKDAKGKDIPLAARRLQVQKALGMITGMMFSFAGIAVLGGWKPWEEDDPEEFVASTGEMIAKSLLNTVPVAGSGLVSGYEGFLGSGVDPVPAATELGRLMKAFSDQDDDKILKRIAKVAETTAVMTGTPVMPIKRGKKAISALMEGEPGDAALEALGYNTGEGY